MGVERMNDPISKMTEREITEACLKILGYRPNEFFTSLWLVGLMIGKLQEWGCRIISHAPTTRVWEISPSQVGAWICHESLQVAFLRTAIALGKWEAPKVKEEAKFAHFLTSEGNVLSISLGLGDNADISYFAEFRGFKRVRVSPWEEAK